MPVVDHPVPSNRRTRVVTSAADLVEVLRRQHHELRTELARVAELEGAAREDVFLQVRRRLAVHEALEELVLTPRLEPGSPEDQVEVSREVAAAEQLDPGSAEFDAAHARMVVAHLHHAHAQERDVLGRLSGALTEEEQTIVARALRLWDGEGEAYLGHGFARMLASAREQLAGTTP